MRILKLDTMTTKKFINTLKTDIKKTITTNKGFTLLTYDYKGFAIELSVTESLFILHFGNDEFESEPFIFPKELYTGSDDSIESLCNKIENIINDSISDGSILDD